MSSAWSQDLYIQTYRFAAHAHRWQKVPGTSLPYIMHLSFVAMEMLAVAAVEDIGDANLAMQCALLHDTLEDTRVRYEQLQENFGQAVADGVLALTLNKRLPRPAQMSECLERIRAQRTRDLDGQAGRPHHQPAASAAALVNHADSGLSSGVAGHPGGSRVGQRVPGAAPAPQDRGVRRLRRTGKPAPLKRD